MKVLYECAEESGEWLASGFEEEFQRRGAIEEGSEVCLDEGVEGLGDKRAVKMS